MASTAHPTSPSPESPRSHFRALARRSVNLPATLALRELGIEYPVRLLDLSLGGARISVSDSLPVGASILIILSAPQLWDPLEITGEVVWTRQAAQQEAIGVRFHEPSGPSLRALAELLEAVLFG